jgi:hypothetical protein
MNSVENVKRLHPNEFTLGMDPYKWKYEDCFAHPDAK